MTTIRLGSFFERGTRENGETFVTLRASRPEWLQDAVYAAHGGDLPGDWIYDECRAACDAIDDGSLADDDDTSDHADGRVDVYTKALYQWAADMCLSNTWSIAEGEADDIGESYPSTERRIALVQYCAIRSIAATILEAWREHKIDLSDDDESEGPSDQA